MSNIDTAFGLLGVREKRREIIKMLDHGNQAFETSR